MPASRAPIIWRRPARIVEGLAPRRQPKLIAAPEARVLTACEALALSIVLPPRRATPIHRQPTRPPRITSGC